MRDIKNFNASLLTFLSEATTPWHAVARLRDILEKAGFSELKESDSWKLTPGKKYFVIRGGSSLAAFILPANPAERGFAIAGAHTDSPALKVKPSPELYRHGSLQLGVEVYGGALLNPWFDRELSLAGRVTWRSPEGSMTTSLIDFKKPLAVIPSLAIHLDRDANKNRTVNAQTHLPPVIMQCFEEKPLLADILKQQLQKEKNIKENKIEEILAHDLFFYDCQPPMLAGLREEFITGARLDNLLSCCAAIQAIADAEGQGAMVILNDHEETGSVTDVGAQGPFFRSLLQRIAGSIETYYRMTASSIMISMDNAHGVHPNFADKFDENHGPLLNRGPVIKRNANQRYATLAETESLVREIARGENIPLQSFVVRSDMSCGSTIGPLSAAETGIPVVDIGVPTWAMHSIRETAGADDTFSLYRIVRKFFSR